MGPLISPFSGSIWIHLDPPPFLLMLDPAVDNLAAKSNGSTSDPTAPEPPRNRAIRPKMRLPPLPSPLPFDIVTPNPDLPVPVPVTEPPTRRQGLRLGNAALAAMNQTAAALQASASLAKRLTLKGRKSAKRAPSEPPTEPLTEPPSEPLQPEPL
ncbi:hypothetical protein FRC09_004421 [Ceratobasidium sp. 395]|nr:hypothetical protein FRC09_004421 [Ceratobasidium sp. 395]